MNLKSKKISLLILGITSIVLSRAMFVFFNDPEGPNLLVVFVAAMIVYGLSLPVYIFSRSTTDLSKLLLTILAQIVIVACFYFGLK